MALEYTYNVIVKTEASRNVPSAIKELTSAQKDASNIFESISKFLSQDFSNTILASLDQRMALWELKQQQIDFPEFFKPVYDGLLEIRAALVTMMDLKEGGFTNTLNTLKLASEAMKETGATIQDAMVEKYKDMYGGIEGIEARSKARARGVYDEFGTNLFDSESSTFLKTDEETGEFKGITDKFFGIDSLETILAEYPESLAKFIKDEFNSFLDQISQGSGTKILKDLIGEEEIELLKTIQQSFKTFFYSAKLVDRTVDEPVTDELKQMYKEAQEGMDKSVPYVFGEDFFDDIKKVFKQGFKNSVNETGDAFLKDENTLSAIDFLIDDLFKKVRDAMIQKVGDSTRKNAPSFGRELQSARKKVGESDDFLLKLRDEYVSHGDDPFGLFGMKDEIQEVLKQSKIEYTEGDAKSEGVLLKDIVKKNLEDVGLPHIVSKSLAPFLVDRMDEKADEIFFEIEEVFKIINNELQTILLAENIGTSLEGVREMIESMAALDDVTNVSNETPIGTAMSINTIDIESVLIDNFKEAKDHRDNWFRDGMVVGINTILGQIEMMRTDMGFNMSQINRSIGNIETSEQLPATTDQIKSK